jgi:hypothetical protein
MEIGDSGPFYMDFGSNLANFISKESQNALKCFFDHPPTYISNISSYSHKMGVDRGTFGGDQR